MSLRSGCMTSAFIFAALCAFSLRGAVTPAPPRNAPIPDIKVWDEAGQQGSLTEQLRQFGPGTIILVPLYTRCMGSCPVLAKKLQVELSQPNAGTAHPPYRVLMISFDPMETGESLARFKTHWHLPNDWLARRADEPETRRLFDFFNYSVMKQNGALIHPSEIFLLENASNVTSGPIWRATLVGQEWSSADLQAVLKEIQSPTTLGRLRWNLELIAKTAFAGLLLTLTLLLAWMVFRGTPHPSAQGSSQL